LSPASFYPRPKVWSAVVVLTPADRGLTNDAPTVLALASQSFRMRRKTLANNLAGWRELSKGEAEACITAAGLAPGIRAEQLSLLDFDRLQTAVRERTG
jgi:16S rRNA (adenine1518-N6/adenine1519-N6)-dimethyltransferase